MRGPKERTAIVSKATATISYKGKEYRLRSLSLGPNLDIVIRGRFIRVGRIRNEFWMRASDLPEIPVLVERLRGMPDRPDILVVSQKLPDVQAKYRYPLEWDNLAVTHFSTYADWLAKQVARDARSQVRKAGREGVRVEVVPFSDGLVEGICSIYNEIPFRQGRKFWHYGKDAEAVKRENSSYLDRSLFLGAYFGAELIGSSSPDGAAWTEVGRVTLTAPPAQLLAGPAVTGRDTSGVGNTATALMILPIASSVLVLLPREPGARVALRGFDTALMLSVAYGATTGGMATLIAEEVIMALRFIYGHQPEPMPGFHLAGGTSFTSPDNGGGVLLVVPEIRQGHVSGKAVYFLSFGIDVKDNLLVVPAGYLSAQA